MFKNNENGLNHSISKFHNKYYRERQKEIVKENKKMVKSICERNSKKGSVSKNKLGEKRFELPKNNKASVKILQFKRIEEDNQVS
jgi:hypothetical protein